jgi:hypothetical protein
VGSTKRLMHLIKVLFPAPEGPMSAMTVFSSKVRETLLSASCPEGYRFTKSLISTIFVSLYP